MRRFLLVVFMGAVVMAGLWFFMQRKKSGISHGSVSCVSQQARVENAIPLAVIGSGPAGLSAAVYGARGDIQTVVFEGKMPGGLLTRTTFVENWPGVAKMLGSDIMKGLKAQAESFGAQIVPETITSVDFSQWPYKLTTDENRTVYAYSVVIATGASPRVLGVPGEQEYWSKGVTACAICDAPMYKNKEVFVVGGGDSAVEQAIQLAAYAKKITMLVRRDVMRAAPASQERLKAYDMISVRYNTKIKKINGDNSHVNSVTLIENGEEKTEMVDGVFLAIGHKPNTRVFKDKLNLDSHGNIMLLPDSQETSVAGVFAAGDVADTKYRQAGVASGDGIKAALSAIRFLQEHGFDEKSAQDLKKFFFDYKEEKEERVPLMSIETEQDFERYVVQSKLPVVCDFYTKFCPSCLQMLPVVESVAARLKDQVTFVKVDLMAVPELGKKLNVTGVPLLVVMENGKEAARNKTIMSKDQLYAFVMDSLGN